MLVYHQVEKFITANRLLSPHDRVLAAVSGGADSLCLVDCLLHLGYEVVIAHFDHQLRLESASEAAAVETYANDVGCRFFPGTASKYAFAGTTASLENAARCARYQFLEDAARSTDSSCIATGHHADDHIETILLHLIRGAGIEGLGGIRAKLRLEDMFPHAWAGARSVVRPLLSCSRDDIDMHCVERGLTPTFDASNLDYRFLRNRVRHELLPLLEALNPGVRGALRRTGFIMQAADSYLEDVVEEIWGSCMEERDDGLWLRLPAFQRMPLALQQRLALRALRQLAPPESDIGYEGVLRLVEALEQRGARRISLPGGLEVWISGEEARLAAAAEPLDTGQCPSLDEECPVTIPGVTRLSANWELTSAYLDPGEFGELPHPVMDGAHVIWVNARAIERGIHMRRWRPGDRFQPFGMQGRMKLADFFTNEKVPQPARATWPLLVSGGKILWVTGIRMSEHGRVGAQSDIVVRFELRPIGGRPS